MSLSESYFSYLEVLFFNFSVKTLLGILYIAG